MLDFDASRALLVAGIKPTATESIPLEKAAGRTVSEPLVAGGPLPPFDYSAMDGYAVRSDDLQGEPPWELPVRGESRTGQLASALPPRSTCRIFTGATIPDGADSVVMQEEVERHANTARFATLPKPGQNIRRAGEDLASGCVALPRGTRLDAFQLGLVAMLDQAEVPVYKKPRVAIVATGDELRAPGASGPPGSIPESNFLPLKMLLECAGAKLTSHTIARDEERELRTALADALSTSDLLVTIGGVSVGDHDLVRPTLHDLKVQEVFWKVAMKPGKPVYYGRSEGQHVLGLPGNPASAQITFALFGVPLLRALQGAPSPFCAAMSARLAHSLERKGGRREFYRAKLDGGVVRLMSNQASGAPSMAWANALVDIPADCETLREGEIVATLPILLL